MKKIGIFYICTGSYKLFWNDFFCTSEKNFLPDTEKHYFIFSDSSKLESLNERCHINLIQNMPWPLITLLRFHFFVSIEKQLDKMDFLMFSNSNMKFIDTVFENDFLPRQEQNEEIFVVEHPGYINCKPFRCPFERNKNSTAYIPYNIRTPYVIGAMNGGGYKGFMKMSYVLKRNIETDLKKNVIARWHDESHLNKYISINKNFRLLSPSYCYPYGFDIECPKKIIAVGKQEKFDVKKFKGMGDSEKLSAKAKRYFEARVKPEIGFVIDSVLNKKL